MNDFFSKSRIARVKPARRDFRRRRLIQPPAPVKHEQQVLEIKTYMIPPIMWVGEDYDNLFAQGSLYAFSCQWFVDTDLSSIYHAKCIVVSCTDAIDKILSFVNFACEYGIPSIWLHRHLPPDICFWSFTHRVHIDDSNLFWRDVCQLIA